MTLSELFGDNKQIMTAEERAFLETATAVWSKRFSEIVKESRGPSLKTRIHVIKGNQDG